MDSCIEAHGSVTLSPIRIALFDGGNLQQKVRRPTRAAYCAFLALNPPRWKTPATSIRKHIPACVESHRFISSIQWTHFASF
jgi:hypothetical protein